MITKYTDFEKGQVYIPIHSLHNEASQAIIEDIKGWIEIVEPKVMIDFSTQEFYDAILEGLDEDPIEARWTVLRDKLALALSHFIFVQYSQHHQTLTTEAGEKGTQSANLLARNAYEKTRTIYNAGVTLLESVYDFLQDNETYPEFEDIDFNFTQVNFMDI
jgi:hypothetical protein